MSPLSNSVSVLTETAFKTSFKCHLHSTLERVEMTDNVKEKAEVKLLVDVAQLNSFFKPSSSSALH